MGGSGGPSPKGKKIDNAKVMEIEDGLVTFSMDPEDAAYFGISKTYQLVAIKKEND